MRRILILALATFLGAAPVLSARAQDAAAPAAPAAAAPAERPVDYFPLVVGLGAVAGVVGYNVLAFGLGAVPGGLAYGVGGALVVPAEMSVAMSRVYATVSAVAGGLIAYYAFNP